jgi:hypothetical protein
MINNTNPTLRYHSESICLQETGYDSRKLSHICFRIQPNLRQIVGFPNILIANLMD